MNTFLFIQKRFREKQLDAFCFTVVLLIAISQLSWELRITASTEENSNSSEPPFFFLSENFIKQLEEKYNLLD